jgi:single-strand DNA-binding protein
MNKATLIGRLAADPELRQTGSGIAVTSFTIAVDRPYTKGSDRQTDWIDIVAWRNTAEFVCKYFQKGSPIIIEGSIQTRMWEDKAGQKRKSVEIVAENVELFPEAKTQALLLSIPKETNLLRLLLNRHLLFIPQVPPTTSPLSMMRISLSESTKLKKFLFN